MQGIQKKKEKKLVQKKKKQDFMMLNILLIIGIQMNINWEEYPIYIHTIICRSHL